MEYAIRATNIVRAFPAAGGDTFYALKGIDMDIPKGRLTILKGRSGSGKTTLLNILSALDEASEGEVFISASNQTRVSLMPNQAVAKSLTGGRELGSMSAEERERLRRYEIGFVFQSVALIPIMNAYENVDYGLRLSGYKKNRDARIKQVLKMVGLGGRMNHMPMQMSGGEQQRVAIARAVAHKPKIIFADEPTGALDTASGLTVVKLFKELIENEGTTIVMTTHDPGMMELGDVVYELEDGEIIGRKEYGTGTI